ncbi:MAG: hypothetical protein K5930_09715 [Treponemataceae bacterium]|nr:hypothetical protein [Treponemataceae bacterium]
MKRRVFLVAVLMLCAVFTVSAFNPFGYADSIKKGGMIIDAGVGYGWGFDIHATCDVLVPIAAGSVNLPLSFGGNVDFAFGSGMGLAVDARAMWHFDIGIPELDVYIGPSLGFWMYGIGKKAVGAFDAGGVTGARWFFTDSMAAFLEAGYTGLTYAKAGVSFLL